MSPLYQNDLVLATFHCKHTGSLRVSMVTLAYNDAAQNLSASQWAEGLHVAWGDNMQGPLTTEASWTKCTVLKGDGTAIPEVGESVTGPFAGVVGTATPPPNVAALVKKKTGFGGRQNRGRVFLPWSLSENDVDEQGVLNQTVQNVITSGLLGFKSASANLIQVIANRVYDLPWDNPARQLIAVTIGKEVISMTVDPLAATQRRRLR